MNRSVSVSFALLFSLSTVLLIPLSIHTVKASAASIGISPNTTVQNGADFVLNITVNNASDMHAWNIDIKFRKVIKITNVVAASWVVSDYSYNYYELAVNSTAAGAELHFTTVYNGMTQIDVLGSTILDSEGNEIPHLCSSCSVTVLGDSEQYFLNVRILGYESYDVALGMMALNVAPDASGFYGNGTMTYVYDSYTNVTIEATEHYRLCQYIRVDNTTYTTKAICVIMNSDHEVLAFFRFPVLTAHTTEPDTEVQIGFNSGVTNSSGYVAIESPVGNWTLKAAKWGYWDVIQDIALTGDRSIDIQMNKTSYIYTPQAVGVRNGTWMTYEAMGMLAPDYYNVTVENVTGTVISGYTEGIGRFLLDISTGLNNYGLPSIIPANLAAGQFIPPLVPFNSTAYVQDVVYWHGRKAIRATGYDHGYVYTFYWDQRTGVLLEKQSAPLSRRLGGGVTRLVRTNAFDDDLACRTELGTTVFNETTLEINLMYESDGIPVEEAFVTVGTKRAENMGNGKYIAVLDEWTPCSTLHVHVEGLLVTKDFDVSFPAGGNTDIPLALVIGLAAVIVIASAAFIAKHRKTKQPTRPTQMMQACVKIRHMKTIYIKGISVILILILIISVGYLLTTIQGKPLSFCAYQPYFVRKLEPPEIGCNMTEIISDLTLIKGMGFDGVKIFYEKIVDSGIVEPLLYYTKKIGLKVIFATHATYWGWDVYRTIDFPNETILSNYKRELGAICGNITAHKYDNVPFMAVLYPIPFNNSNEEISDEKIHQKLDSAEFKNALIDIVNYVKSFGLKVSMDTEGDPNRFPVPLIPNADLYGIMPWSPNTDYMNTTHIESWASYFKPTGKQVYMSEYGFRTGLWPSAMASNETVKAKLVTEFVNYCRKNFGVFTYILLFDNSEGGWGLAEKDTRTLRESGIAMLEALRN